MSVELPSTHNVINPSSEAVLRYPNRSKDCKTCGVTYLVSLKKSIRKSQYCSYMCQPKGHWNKGRHLTNEHKAKLAEAFRGERSPFWQGGITAKHQLIRSSWEYQEWRKAVFERDDYTCQECQARGVKLNADHILPFAYFPEHRFDVSNGRTLCVPCHEESDTYKTKIRTKYPHLAPNYKKHVKH